MTTTITPKEAVISLMKAAVPEREEEIMALWKKYNPEVMLAPNTKGITLNVHKGIITFNPKTMDIFWLIGFSGWCAIECYSPHVLVSARKNQKILKIIQQDNELERIERDYKTRCAIARSLIETEDNDFKNWPPDIPHPAENLENIQHKAAYDLTCLAAAFVYFHEFRHVMLDFDDHQHKDRREEELDCDVWARQFMTEKLSLYASLNSHEYHEVLQKRSMGLAIAALILHEITPTFEHVGNPCYFSIKVRLQAILDNTPLPEESHFWILMASLLIGLFRQKHRPIDFQPMSPHLLASYLLNHL